MMVRGSMLLRELLLAAALLPLCVSSASDIITVAVGSDIALCGMTCKPGRLCDLQRLPEATSVVEYNCDSHQYKSFNKLYDRINASAASECATIRNAQRNDTGRYQWKSYDIDGRFTVTQSASYYVMDKVSVTNLTSRDSNSGQSTSLQVQFTGDQVTVTWSRYGGDLPEGHQLSDFNETLTVRNEDYGTYRVTVTNPVSEDQAEHTLTGQESFSGRMRLFWILLCFLIIPFVWVFIRMRRATHGNSLHQNDEDARNSRAGYTELDCIERAENATASCMDSPENAKASCMDSPERAKASCMDSPENAKASCMDSPKNAKASCMDSPENAKASCMDSPENAKASCMDSAENAKASCMDSPENAKASCMDSPENAKASCMDSPENAKAACMSVLNAVR